MAPSWLLFQLVDDVVAGLEYFPVHKILDADARENSNAHEGYGGEASFRIAERVVDFREQEAHERYHQDP